MSSSRLDSFAELNSRITQCRDCPRLVHWREDVAVDPPRRYRGQDYWQRPVPGFGDLLARIWIVGLAPAAHGGNRTGRVFTGDSSGDFLFARLFEAGFANQPTSVYREDGLTVRDLYISPAVRCAPPDNRPSPEEFRRCAPFLLEELQVLRPTLRVILPLGALAWGSTLTLLAAAGYRVSSPLPAFAHGAEATIGPGSSGRPLSLLGSYHVSRQNTNTGRLTREMFARILSRARDLTSPAAPSR